MINSFSYEVEEGNSSVFWNLRRYSNNNDLSTPEAYEYIDRILDIDNFIDYYILQYTLSNYDAHNVRMYNNSDFKNGKIRMILYDSDYGLRSDAGAYFLDYIMAPYFYNPMPDTSTLRGLLKNPKFRKRFLERMSYFLKETWNEKNINETFDEIYYPVDKEMERNAARWGYDYNSFAYAAKKLKKDALKKANVMAKYTKSYFKLSNEEYNEYFG